MPKHKPKQAPQLIQGHLIDVDTVHDTLALLKPRCHDNTAYAFKWDYLNSELLSKFPRSGVPQNVRATNAITKMLESEESCAAINHSGYGTSTPRDFFESVMHLAARLVTEILGPVDYGIFIDSTFSAGASTTRPKKNGDPYYKYDANRTVETTAACEKYARALISLTPLWRKEDGSDPDLQICMGNHVTTVPKKTEIDRAIAKEPDMNMCLQRSVGGHIRKRLKRFGVDLNDQTRNQRLAKQGSIDGSLATIDLSAASDSLSYKLVMDLLPYDWFALLDDLRSPYGVLPDGRMVTWEKFSSMGNGFTFELESMIFFALAHSVIKVSSDFKECPGYLHTLGVYGDDLIIASEFSRNLITVLDDVGFKTNTSKTFISGPFRESCGKHYYNGYDVTPFYIRKPIDSLTRVIWFLNKLRDWATDANGICDPTLYELWLTVRRKFVPSDLLGGNDVQSISAVASPEELRNRLIPVTIKRRIDGYRAILRCFQYQSTVTENKYVNYIDIFTDPNVAHMDYALKAFDPNDMSHLVRVNPTRYRKVPNRDLWTSCPLFPQEIRE